MRVDKDLLLFDNRAKINYASGGFAAGVDVGGHTNFGSQQQWVTRHSSLRGGMDGGAWSLVFVGVDGAPPTRPRTARGPAYSTVNSSPTVAEKPYVSIGDDGKFLLMIPQYKTGAVGASIGAEDADAVPFERVFVARDDRHGSTEIQAALDQGYHILFSPGIYYLSDALLVKGQGQVLLGIGMATLVSSTNGCIKVKSEAKGVRIAGLTLQASIGYPECLMEIGEESKPSGDAASPCVLSDIFIRVGGPLMRDGKPHREAIKVGSMVMINSNYTIGDNLW